MAINEETLKELGKLALNLSNNPETRDVFLESVQKVNPQFTTPDLESKKIRSEMNARFDSQEQDRQRQESLQKMATQRQGLIDSKKYTNEDVEKIENEVMTKYGLSDYDAAATLYSASTAPARGTPEIKSTSWEMPDFKGIMQNPKKWALDEANAAMGDIIANRNSRR